MGMPCTVYEVEWKFIGDLCGSTPSDPAVLRKALEVRKPKVKPPGEIKSIGQIEDTILETLDQEEEEPLMSKNVFSKDPKERYLVMRAHNIRAHLKEAARVAAPRWGGRLKGEGSLATRVKQFVYPDPEKYWIPILRQNGDKIMKADGEHVKPVHIDTWTGKRDGIKIFEYISFAMMRFDLHVYQNMVKFEDLDVLMDFAGLPRGFGGERSAGEGKYIATISKKGVSNDDTKK
jgi:hypothetical protein